MKTWQMIKALSENPKLKFVRVGDTRRFRTSPMIKDGQTVDCYVSDIVSPSECILLNDEWELVKEPVDFMTAVKAFAEGTKIMCDSEIFGKRYYVRQSDICEHLKDDRGMAVSAQEVIDGKWYIECS